MNTRLILVMLGKLMRLIGVCMVAPLIIAIIGGEYSVFAFSVAIALLVVFGTLLTFIKPRDKNLFARDGFVIVGAAWVIISLFGCLPSFISGAIPSFTDAFFESVSGFTTTGASILSNVEALPNSLLFWRSFTHFLGGMGVLVFMLAILPKVDARTLYVLKAEASGPSPGKLVPKLTDSARILYIIYICMTAILIGLLLIAGMPVFDSFVNAFATAGTGGFSIRNASIAAYDSPLIDGIITLFMLLFSVNFTVYYLILTKRIRQALGGEELRWFICIVLVSMIAIAVNIMSLYGSFFTALRYSSFQVSSIISTSGFATADYNLWPAFSRTILVLLMLIGGSSGSTGGGIKVVRFLMLLKIIKREFARLIHPRSVNTVRLDKKNASEDIISGVQVFMVAYVLILLLSTLLISFDGYDLETNFTAVLAALSNIGPGLSLVGPMCNYSIFSPFSKIVLSADMLIGRLEIFPILLMCFSVPMFFRRRASRFARKRK